MKAMFYAGRRACFIFTTAKNRRQTIASIAAAFPGPSNTLTASEENSFNAWEIRHPFQTAAETAAAFTLTWHKAMSSGYDASLLALHRCIPRKKSPSTEDPYRDGKS
jgi:hypothetical protein